MIVETETNNSHFLTMNVDQAIRQRRSVRGFLPTPVPAATLREVFELAQLAPSNCNVQPWSPHVVSGPMLRRLQDELVAVADASEPTRPDWPADVKFEGIYRKRQIEAAAQLYGAMGVERHDRVGRHAAFVRNQASFGAPHAMFIFLPQPFDTREAIDAGIYVQTLMLALVARGIGSCAQGALRLYPDIVRRHLRVPDSHRLLFGLAFGYEDTTVDANTVRVGRAAVDDVVTFHDVLEL